MAEIRETDLMLVCLEAGKALVREFNPELNNALGRISDAMYEGSGNATVTRAEDNPVDRDIATRVTLDTIQLVMEMEGKLDG